VWGAIGVSSREELPPDTEQRLEKFTDLVTTAIVNADARSELAASRTRIVSAADEARRRIERDLHDGIQQRLIALSLRARALTQEPTDETPRIAAGLCEGLLDTSDEVREISRGIHPAILTEAGLRPALRALERPARRRRRARRTAPGARRGRRLLHRLRGPHERRQARSGEPRQADRRARQRRSDPGGPRRRHRRRRRRQRLRHSRPHRPHRGARRDDRDHEPSGRRHDPHGAAAGGRVTAVRWFVTFNTIAGACRPSGLLPERRQIR
jgi:hypothetical protein